MEKLKDENLVAKDSPYYNTLMANKIKVGKNNIFERGVEIETQGGEIEIGSNNVFEALVRIINPSPTEKMVIGSFNHFETRVSINGCNIGNINTFKTYCNVIGCLVKDYCVVGMLSTLTGRVF